MGQARDRGTFEERKTAAERDIKTLLGIRQKLLASGLPPKGKPAAELTQTERMALCVAAGAGLEMKQVDGAVVLFTSLPCGITDRGDGGYKVHMGGGK